MSFERAAEYLRQYGKPVTIMEVCGTHTSSIVKSGLRELLPANIRLVSGPGCPVCVTSASYIDTLAELSLLPGKCVLSFGDMLRVAGHEWSFEKAQAAGGSFRLMYSPLEAAEHAKANPATEFILAAVGFETTAPLYAVLLEKLTGERITNVRMATALKTMPAALDYVCGGEAVDGFLCPGHVSGVIGSRAYEPLCEKYKKPFAVAGFEPERIILALCRILRQLEDKKPRVENLYPGVVTRDGNKISQELMARFFVPSDAVWRGIGEIKSSGLRLRPEFRDFEAVFSETDASVPGHLPCRCGDVMLGRIFPDECGLFGKICTPGNPVGACMVSNEGACGIWYGSCGGK